jgi:FAD/FMN-containing dehydrogenase
MSAHDPAFLAALAAIVDERGLVTDPADLAPHLGETRGLIRGEASALLRPADTSEVAAIMRLAHAARVPVVIHGGNTGLVGGGVPFGGVVMSLARLNRIRAVDPVNATITAEAGVVLSAVQAAASAVDRLYPLSLASEGSCTIGGNIATNAGGTAVLRYGNTRDLVLGLEVVLPSGEIWNGLSGLRKDNAGYDLKHLFIGSEGTLGIITAAVLKLFPKPKSRLTGFVGANSPANIVAFFDRLRSVAGEKLSTFEIMPRFGIEIVLKHAAGARDPLESPHRFYALFELTTPELDAPLEDAVMPALAEALETGEIADATLAASETQARAFWALREDLSEYQRHEGGSIKHDVSVPISRIADFMDEAQAACEAAMQGIRVCGFGHIGDGNLHYNLSQPVGMDKAAFLAQWHRFNTIVHDLVAARGGSIAAEHASA